MYVCMYVNTIVLYASDGKGLLPYAYVSENIRSSGNKALIITIIIHKMYACTIDDHKVLPIRGASRCTIQIHVYLARRRRIDVERKQAQAIASLPDSITHYYAYSNEDFTLISLWLPVP